MRAASWISPLLREKHELSGGNFAIRGGEEVTTCERIGGVVNLIGGGCATLGGKGGGKPDSAMGGAPDPTHLPTALANIKW